nr:heat shock protein 16 [Quercus suber]
MTIGYPQNSTMINPVFARVPGTPFLNSHPVPQRSFGSDSFTLSRDGQTGGNPFPQPAPKPYSMHGGWPSAYRQETGVSFGQQAASIDGPYMDNPQSHPWISAFNQGIAHGLRYLKPDIGDSIAREGPNFSTSSCNVSTTHDFGGRPLTEWKRAGLPEFTPEVDVCDTKEASTVLVSLPGGKKENCNVIWDPETSQLTITGTIERESCDGGEPMLRFRKQERKLGAFRRNVNLGAIGKRGAVGIDAVSAKMEAGVLKIIVTRPQPVENSHVTVTVE